MNGPARPEGGTAPLLAALFVLLAGSGCRPAPDRPATLTLAIDSGPASLDPRLGSDEASKRVYELLYSGLFRVDESARPVGDLAADYRMPDPRTVVVRLRQGVLFHDGSRLTSGDVVYTYRSILEDQVVSFRKGDLTVVRSVEAPDDLTVIFTLRAPFAPILTDLNVPILKAGSGADAARRAVGTGPYRLIRYRKDEDLLLARFDRYFAPAGGIAALRLRIIPSETSRLLELLKGNVDMILNDLSPDQLERVRRTPGFVVESRPGRNYVYLGFNLRDPLLSDRRVRQAIALALDRRAIVAHLLHGAATLATGLLPPGHWAYDPEVPRYEHDPAAAASLLDRAGHPDPDGPGPATRFQLTYKTSTSELALQQASVIQEQLAGIGVGIAIRAYEWPTFYDDLKAGRFQIVLSNWTEIADPDIYRLRFHSERLPPDGFNRGAYANPEVDRLLEEGAATLDEAARRRIYGAVQRLLARDLPYVSLWHRDVAVARRERVRGFRLTPGADFFPLREVTLEAAGDRPAAGRASGRSGEPASEDLLHGGDRHRARAYQAGWLAREVQDGRGHAAARRPPVQDHLDRLAEGLDDLRSGGGSRPSGKVGAGGDDRSPRRAREPRGHRVGRDPDADRVPAAEEAWRQIVGGRQHERQGARPEGGRQSMRGLRELAHAGQHRGLVRQDERQSHPLRAPLRLEHTLDRFRVARVGRQAIERLRRIGDEPPGAQELRGPRQEAGVRTDGIDALHAFHGGPPCVSR